MAGYAGRKEPAEGTEQELLAKALALEDRDGQRVVFLTMDLIGVIEQLRTAVAERVQQDVSIAAARPADERVPYALWTGVQA